MRRFLPILGMSLGLMLAAAPAAHAMPGYTVITGSGSTAAADLVDQWIADVRQVGLPVNYAAVGSSTGRGEFRNGTVDFAVTEIPYGLADAQGGLDTLPERNFAYVPLAGSGTAFAYNLSIDGQRVTNLRLSAATVAGIFTGTITRWDDPAITQDNPYLALPRRDIVPVVRSDGSGSTYQLTRWMASETPTAWSAYCSKVGTTAAATCAPTSFFPTRPGLISQNGSSGVSGFVASSGGSDSITYVDYAAAVQARLPVVKLGNTAGYYVEPTASAVSVALRGVVVNTDATDPATYLTQDPVGAYRSTDSRAYPLSSYTYAVVPVMAGGTFRADRGRTLSAFLTYALCEGQAKAPALGYAPLSDHLVEAGFEQIGRIPGVTASSLDPTSCLTPTIEPPAPPACDTPGPVQCLSGTGGLAGTPTPISRPATPSTTAPTVTTSPSTGSSTTDNSTTGSSTTGTSTTGTSTTGTAPASGTSTTSAATTLGGTTSATTGVGTSTTALLGTTPASTPTAPAVSRAGALAVTGATIGPLVALGLSLLLGGAAAARAARRTVSTPPDGH